MVDYCTIGQITGDAELIGCDSHRQVIIRFRLRCSYPVIGMINPEPRVADVAGNTGEEVEWSAFFAGPIVIEVTAVAVGVQMSGEDNIDAELVKQRH